MTRLFLLIHFESRSVRMNRILGGILWFSMTKLVATIPLVKHRLTIGKNDQNCWHLCQANNMDCLYQCSDTCECLHANINCRYNCIPDSFTYVPSTNVTDYNTTNSTWFNYSNPAWFNTMNATGYNTTNTTGYNTTNVTGYTTTNTTEMNVIIINTTTSNGMTNENKTENSIATTLPSPIVIIQYQYIMETNPLLIVTVVLLLILIMWKCYLSERMRRYLLVSNASSPDKDTETASHTIDIDVDTSRNKAHEEIERISPIRSTDVERITPVRWRERSPDIGLTHVERTILGPMVRYMTQPIHPSFIDSPHSQVEPNFIRRKSSKRIVFGNE